MNLKRLAPVLPRFVNAPLRRTQRVHRERLRLRAVSRRQRRPTRRPRVARWTLKRTLAASDSLKLTRVPALAMLEPRRAALKRLGRSLRRVKEGAVWSRIVTARRTVEELPTASVAVTDA